MTIDIDNGKLKETISAVEKHLLESRTQQGFWKGFLSSSALSTATAVFALAMVDEKKYQSQIFRGLKWIADNANNDGGWGDTVTSPANLSTTMLCWAALKLAEGLPEYAKTISDAEKWIVNNVGSVEPEQLLKTLKTKYGKDMTFFSPIMMMCALAGRLGDDKGIWKMLKPLPFELAVLPHKFYKFLRLPVVSYALPALIAIGQLHFHRRRPTNPITRILRHSARDKTYRKLKEIQPKNGGFLEATPLTSFVVMSLAATGKKGGIVASKGVMFLIDSVREDGSWPIDTSLATWLTTLSINALAVNAESKSILTKKDRQDLQRWLLEQQHRKIHPYTNAEPGGWAWNDCAGAVPDADDTAGALIALYNLGLIDENVIEAVEAAVKWLLGIQNRDGGIPTFCKGWNKLPFDRSSADITAHVIIAMRLWLKLLPDHFQKSMTAGIENAVGYLKGTQNEDGSWIALWFGNQYQSQQENPLYGTAKVLMSICQLIETDCDGMEAMISKAVKWILQSQNDDGGWGADKSIRSSMEETSLATDALAGFVNKVSANRDLRQKITLDIGQVESAVSKGAGWLIKKINNDRFTASAIGLYFARLWYYEELYPVIFALSALRRVKQSRHKG